MGKPKGERGDLSLRAKGRRRVGYRLSRVKVRAWKARRMEKGSQKHSRQGGSTCKGPEAAAVHA